MFIDYVMNGQGYGEVAERMLNCQFDPGYLRPYLGEDGRKYVTIKNEAVPVSQLVANGMGMPIHNATLALRKDEWLQMDQVVLRAARSRLRAWGDLVASNTYGGFNAMGKMILEHEVMSDPGEALVDMDGLTEGRTDAPKFQLRGLPLPITHSDFWFSSRRLAISRNSGMPLDTTMGEAAGRRVAEKIEKVLIGVETGITYGTASDYDQNPTVYGYTNHPDRVTKTNMTAPDGTNGPAVLTSWLQLRELMYAQNFYGPFMVYTSTDYDQYLDNLFSTTEPSAGTLRSRLLQIDGISGIRRLDYLTNTFTVLFVQMTSDVARAINGLDLTTVQWESKGGMQLNFKVMAIQVPQLRSDFNGNCGIGHGTTA